MIKNSEYYNEIIICENNDFKDELLHGEVYVDENSLCEGFVEDCNKQFYFIFGKYDKNNKFELYTINNSGFVIKYEAKKTIFKYNGKCTIIGDNLKDLDIPITIKVINYDLNTKENFYNMKSELKEQIKIYKDSWLQDEINCFLYDKYMNILFNDSKGYVKKWVV